ncbi:unnamed protein product [Phytophthora fragariaefolia]|uniref:Unnamed protein product n=1 Tax=Phytophthora fragariaefolia TaxID=1490495 RepID=A0A9W6X1H9_9STRA|nr:unnamed protein product [Phytophthora fragariaefolia]
MSALNLLMHHGLSPLNDELSRVFVHESPPDKIVEEETQLVLARDQTDASFRRQLRHGLVSMDENLGNSYLSKLELLAQHQLTMLMCEELL